MVMDDETPPEELSSMTLLEFKSLRSQHASKYSTNVEVSDLRVIVQNNDPGYEIQREEFISRKIGLVPLTAELYSKRIQMMRIHDSCWF